MDDSGNLNPHQFGDQGVLFDAPLGQPERGTFKGNPAARLYRAVQIPRLSLGVDENYEEPGHAHPPFDQMAADAVQYLTTRPRRDAGHDVHLGIHWQHDRDFAHDYANDLRDPDVGLHGEHGIPVIVEADHPGHAHVVDDTPQPGGGVPDEVHKVGRHGRNRLTGQAKDWALIDDTVGPHNMNAAMLPEVPIRPGAPMNIRAIHLPDPAKPYEYIRTPYEAKGEA